MTIISEFEKRSTSDSMLKTRININDKYSSFNFQKWLFDRIQIRKGQKILDVGCGEGAQTILFAKKVGPFGKVSSIDISEGSIKSLIEKASKYNLKNIQTYVGDMMDLHHIFKYSFKIKKYDLIHSSYALYYAKDPRKVMDIIYSALKRNGTMAIFVPYQPHGLVEFIKEFYKVDNKIEESLTFGPKILEPFFRNSFYENTIYLFRNEIKIKSESDFQSFYQSTTYYNQKFEKEIIKEVNKRILKNGYFEYVKNGYLIVGKEKIR